MLTAKALGALLLPPGILILVAVAGLLLLRRRPRLGTTLIAAAVLALLALSAPLTGHALLASLEGGLAALDLHDAQLPQRAGAIVVLGGGREWNAPEYAADTVNRYTLERLRYAARLQRATGLPLLVSGGSVLGEPVPEAELMRRSLAQDFGVRAEWIEPRSRNTCENALHTRALLRAARVDVAIVVTHAWHMPRAQWCFARAGLKVIPAPVGFSTASGSSLAWLPTAQGLAMSRRALRERLALLWYRLRYSDRPGPAADAAAPGG